MRHVDVQLGAGQLRAHPVPGSAVHLLQRRRALQAAHQLRRQRLRSLETAPKGVRRDDAGQREGRRQEGGARGEEDGLEDTVGLCRPCAR
eukprot:4959579-Prymnesium_polylepis.1